MKKGIIYGSVTILLLVLIIWKLEANKSENAERTEIVKKSSSAAVPVHVEKAHLSKFENNFLANGTFEPIRQITLASEASGRIVQLNVQEGDFVKPGQILARIDNEVVSAEVASAHASLDQAKLDQERFAQALKSGGVTQKQLDDINLQYEAAEARYISAKKRQQDSYIKAPFQGNINKKLIELGAFVSPGTQLFEIVDITKLKLVVSVPEIQVVNLQQGQTIKVKASVFPEVEFVGKISFIASKGDRSLNYPVQLEVDNVSGKSLKAGMYGTANFDLPTQQSMMLIPRSAFYGGVNSNSIFVLENDAAKLKKIVAGRVLGEKVEVRGGLQEGEMVITSGQINLVDGTKVTVQQQ